MANSRIICQLLSVEVFCLSIEKSKTMKFSILRE